MIAAVIQKIDRPDGAAAMAQAGRERQQREAKIHASFAAGELGLDVIIS
jgi:hypothetical protein